MCGSVSMWYHTRMSDVEQLEVPETVSMRLKCGKCGHVARYNVGTVVFDPDAEDRAAEAAYFTGYFRCRKCKSSGPWEFVSETYLVLTALTVSRMAGLEDERFQFGKMFMFDGSPSHSPAQGEDYLKEILEREPDNAFVWSRLGNVYRSVGRYRAALQAYRKAVELNPGDLESHFGIGSILFEQEKSKLAAQHLHQVLILAREDRRLAKDFKREMVSSTLGMLVEMNQMTDGKIPVLPKFPIDSSSDSEKPLVVYLTEFDLSKETDWERFVDMALGEPTTTDGQDVREVVSKVGRNAPCPCGSGKKYKKCCGR